MTLFTKREKNVILFLVCTLILGYGVKLYQGSHLYDDFKPVTLIEKESFEKKATLAYDISKGKAIIDDYRGIKVLSVYNSISLFGQAKWALISEIDKEEAEIVKKALEEAGGTVELK